ncbi:MAG: enolase C-terminal domain-like protein [Acidobacteriota bacterium]
MTPSATATIQRLDVRALRVPMTEPHRTASGVITESPLVLIDVHLDDGTVGHGLLFVYTTVALRPTTELVENIAAMIVGQPLAPAEVQQSLMKRFRLLGSQGLVGIALAGIDMALWDALARSSGLSLVQLLGGVEKPLRAYGAVGYDGVDGSARTAALWASRGLSGIKAKIGYPTVKDDLAVIRAMRSAAGDDMAIMVDYNQSLTPAEACERIRVLDGEGLAWVEEPTLAHDFQGHALVAKEVRTPIQCGENWWGTQDLQHAMDAGASDFVMLDVMKVGGVTGWMRGAAMAHARGLLVSSHLWPEISAQLLCATPTAHWLEYADWWNPIIAEPLRLEGGFARVDGVLGTGVSWNEDVVARFAV